MKIKYERLEEANMLFETIKTILMTWLSQVKIKNLLNEFTHFEIRGWKFVNGQYIITDLIMHDGHSKKNTKPLL